MQKAKRAVLHTVLCRFESCLVYQGSNLWYSRTMPYKDPEKQKAAQRRYYEENKSRYEAANRDRRNRFRRVIDETKAATPCMDCGIQYPSYVMDFDHRPGEAKIGEVSQLMYFSSIEKLMEEIAKCDIVCSNCHRHRTWMRSRKMISSG